MSYLAFKKVRTVAAADAGAVNVILFRGQSGRICGWFLGSVAFSATGINLPYLPRSEEAHASIAVLRAVDVARAATAPVCIVDPDDLWEPAWKI